VSYASPAFRVAFVALVLVMAVAFPAAVRAASRRAGEAPERTLRRGHVAAAAMAAWLALTGVLGASGLVARTALPPPLFVLLLAATAATVALAFSPLGALLARHLPLALLVGYQAFRIPVELLLHQGHVEGFVPVQMTYVGLNFDVATGISALAVAWALRAGRLGRRGVLVWNVAGLLLLANIVTIALLSAPTPLRAFPGSPSNAWVRHAPWIWLPTVLVQAALLGHLLVFRALRSRA
jgi:hypothetical protein